MSRKIKSILPLLITIVMVFLVSLLFKDKIVSTLQEIRPISYLKYTDLVKLANKNIEKAVYDKLQRQLNTPYIAKRTNLLKKKSWHNSYLRLAQWNISRGYKIDKIKDILTRKTPLLNKELVDFVKSDIISLNEVDVGIPRTQYKNVVAELADALNYNYAFATEFIELAPLLYKQPFDPKRFLGLHGNAILSRYPIKNAKVLRLPECYKWFETEISEKSSLEYGRRFGAKTIFKVHIKDEPRIGGRNAVVADIELPNNEIITVVSVHLEDRCFPLCRLNQVKYLLENIKYFKRPVVIAGDFNTSTTDSAPTSVKKEIGKRIKDPHFIARQLALAFLVPGLPPGVGNLAAATIGGALRYKDPVAVSVPVLFPNKEKGLFMYLKDFMFADGESFDFSGDSKRSSNGKVGILANSNERQLKGFESTFSFAKPFGVAYFKLDWFFVKPKGNRFLPFNGQTLKLVNEAFGNKISDHDPITVDLTL